MYLCVYLTCVGSANDFEKVEAEFVRQPSFASLGLSFKHSGRPPLSRVLVSFVLADSPAHAQGLAPDDVLIQVSNGMHAEC